MQTTMRIAVYSDIHANLPAYEAVLDDISRQGIDACYNLGDLVGYGPFPKESVQLAERTGHPTVLGNHDQALIDHVNWLNKRTVACKTRSYGFTHNARESVQWAAKQLRDGDAFLRTLPFKHTLPGIEFMHASPFSYVTTLAADEDGFSHPNDLTITLRDEWYYVCDAFDITAAFMTLPPSTIAFFGHSHVPFVHAEGNTLPAGLTTCGSRTTTTLPPHKRVLVNVGSVGQPRDRIPEACYCVYDVDTHRIEFRSVHYDLERTRKACWDLNTGWSNQEAIRLLHGA